MQNVSGGRQFTWVKFSSATTCAVFFVGAINSYRGNGQGAESVMVLTMKIGLAGGGGEV